MPPTLLFNRSGRARFQFSGGQIVATLNGLVTNDVATLSPGQGQYAGILTPKSKILADVRIFMLADGFLVDTSETAAPGVRDFFKKYLNPRFAKYTELTDSTSDLGVFGDRAREIVSKAADVDSDALNALPPYGHVTGRWNGLSATILRSPELGVEGYDLIVPREAEASLVAALVNAGAEPGSADAWKAMRIAIGWPEWGIDMDENTLPQEANFDDLHALSHSKGCYIGHETIARIHFRGHVNRTLRRLSFAGSRVPPRGAELFDEGDKNVGSVTSATSAALPLLAYTLVEMSGGTTFGSAGDPEANQAFGIGMVRREVETGAVLTVRWDDGTIAARVVGNAKGTVE